jgi:predicted CopG family antitoxin
VKENQNNIKLLSSFLDFENDSDFLLKYGNLKKQNIQIFEKYFGEK